MNISEIAIGKDFKVPSKWNKGNFLYLTVALKQFNEGSISVYSHSTGNTIQVKPDYDVTPVDKIPEDYLKLCRKNVNKKEIL